MFWQGLRSTMVNGERTIRSANGSGECDPDLWGALLGGDDHLRLQAVRTIRALEEERMYADALMRATGRLLDRQRQYAGDALSLLGDPRFAPPFYLAEMMAVPAGRVIVGSPEFPAEQPVHLVVVQAFSLAQYPVTNGAYAAFVTATGHRRPTHWPTGGPPEMLLNAPVVWVSARDAESYCRWLRAETGNAYRLPTEAEWVAAARGRNDPRTYPWGNDFSSGCANTWGAEATGRLCAVGMFPGGCGPYGHMDLAGNVWEWCSSLNWSYPYRADDGRENPGPDREQRVIHGGSWRSRPVSVRCSARQGELPTDRFEVVGFRLARSA